MTERILLGWIGGPPRTARHRPIPRDADHPHPHATMAPVPTVTIYGRPGCHLCEDALAVVERIRADAPFALETVNIEDDDALLRAYLERIPVVALDGVEVYDFHVDEADLRARLARVSRR